MITSFYSSIIEFTIHARNGVEKNPPGPSTNESLYFAYIES